MKNTHISFILFAEFNSGGIVEIPEAIEIKRIEKTNLFSLILYSNGIIEVNWSDDLEIITYDLLLLLTAELGSLGDHKKVPVYIATKPFLEMTPDAKKYSNTKEAQRRTLANAVLVDNLAKRIVFNFYVKFNKMPNQIKAFATKEDAFTWLEYLQVQEEN